MSIAIRTYRPGELPILQQITVEAFDGVAFDQMLEHRFGVLSGRNWRYRKAEHIACDVAANPGGIFVAEEDGRILGYITAILYPEVGRGHIPNLALTASARGKGVGRRLIEHALDYFRREGMTYAQIETLDTNVVGQHLYPSCGFIEIARQVQYALKL